jgi:hypothetical protein
MKVVMLLAVPTGRLYPPGNTPSPHFCQKLSRPQGHSAAGRIVSMKNSDDIIGNRTRDLPTCSEVPQQTAPPRAPDFTVTPFKQSSHNVRHLLYNQNIALCLHVILLRNINYFPKQHYRLIFIIQRQCVFCEVRTALLCIRQISG